MASDSPELAPAPRKESPVRKLDLGRFFSNAVMFLAEIIIPVILAVAILYFLTGAVSFWSLDPVIAELFFGVAVVALSLGISVALDTFISGRTRKAKGTARLRQYQLRLARLGLGGLIFPLAIVLVANLVPLYGKQTAMNLFVQLAKRSVQTTPTTMISSAVMHASNPTTRVQGIQALQSVHTLDAQNELLRILKEDPNALKDGTEYTALAQALASYGLDAKANLLEIFRQADPAATKTSSDVTGDLYDRYLALPVEALQAEIKAQAGASGQQDRQLAQVSDAAASFKSAIDALQTNRVGGAGASLQDFVLSTFLAMDLKQDADLIGFAKTTAADPAFSDRVRGRALLLLSAQGGKGELDTMFTYLQNSSEVLQAYALQAIASAEAKPAK